MKYQILSLILGVLLLDGCSKKSSDDPQPTSANLVKTWRVDSDIYTFGSQNVAAYNRAGDQTKNIVDLSSARYTFKADNSYVIADSSGQESGTWVLQNGSLTLTESATKDADTYKVDKLDGSSLVLSQVTSASALSANDISFFKNQYNVDASGGFKETATFSPN